MSHIVTVDRILEDLIPGFLKNRQADVEAFEKMYAELDFDSILRLAHQLKGVGPNYGFHELGQMALVIEEAAKQKNAEPIKVTVDQIRYYIKNVKIEFVD